ncbi:MAG: Transport permease protein, partial [Ilumatobacteraceae bacterium]|nr:Transport permease protein [Ilumatobacteraceae bacterium]
GVARQIRIPEPAPGQSERPCRDQVSVRCRAVVDHTAALTAFAKVLPLTHALAVMRYGLLDSSAGLHDIWGMHSTTAMAALSLGVVGAFAALLLAVAIRTFSRTSVQ